MEKDKPQRTRQQNKAGHLWFTMFAEKLNDAGLDQRKVLSQMEYNIPFTSVSFKECIFKPIMRSMYGYESTTQLTTKEFTEVCDVITREFGDKFGMQVDFPSIETLMMHDRLKD